MSVRRLIAILALAVVPCRAASASGTTGQTTSPDGPVATAHVVGLAASTVYLDAGRAAGLREGDRIEVLHDGSPSGWLQVQFLSSNRAACQILDGSGAIAEGDVVRFTPHDEDPAWMHDAKAGTEPARPRRRGTWARRNGLRGRVGVQYLTVRDRSPNGAQLTQPAVDLRLEGRRIGGSPIGVSVDVRGRRTATVLADSSQTSQDTTRVYRAALAVNEPHSGMTLVAGRQYSSALSAVSLFDGALVDFRQAKWAAGAFSGSQPDPVDLGYSTQIREHGVYGELHNRPGARASWAFVAGLIGSYEEGQVNREFLYVQSRFNSRRWALLWLQEVDYNRDWKTEFARSTVSPTSTLCNVRVQATRGLAFYAGYDDRERIRLYRDRETPETEFDDANRTGVRGGWNWRSRIHYRLGMDARHDAGGASGDSNTYTMTLDASDFTVAKLGIGTRATYYVNPRAEGWLYSGVAGINVGQRTRVQLGGGVRNETLLETVVPVIPGVVPVTETRVSWYTLDVDFSLGRSWYLLFSGERTIGEVEETDQLYSAVSYRF